jgi:DNA recombination protein RmuC
MEIIVIVASALVAAIAAVAATTAVLRRGEEEAVRRTEARAAAEREVVVRQVTVAAGEQLRSVLAAGSKEIDHQGRAIDRQVTAMAQELGKVTDLVAGLQRDRAEQHGEVVQRLTEATQVSRRLGDTTHALREALASPKARGQWGERLAEDVLRTAGLHEGTSYWKQKATPAGTIPDFTFPVGDGRLLHMDVKFPVSNYLRHLEADGEAERAQTKQAFLRDVRARLKELGGRDYADPESTVGFLLLFIPNEAVYGFVHEHDPDLLEAALKAKVVPCSPSTLFGVLAVIRQAHDNLVLERTSDEILECLGGFTGQWEKFCGQMEKVGRSLETAHGAFGDLSGTRRRALQRQVDRVDDLRRRRGLAEPDGVGLVGLGESGEVMPLRLGDVG